MTWANGDDNDVDDHDEEVEDVDEGNDNSTLTVSWGFTYICWRAIRCHVPRYTKKKKNNKIKKKKDKGTWNYMYPSKGSAAYNFYLLIYL